MVNINHSDFSAKKKSSKYLQSIGEISGEEFHLNNVQTPFQNNKIP